MDDKRDIPRCSVCGEETGGNPTNSLYGLVHKWGPTDHPFTTKYEVKRD